MTRLQRGHVAVWQQHRGVGFMSSSKVKWVSRPFWPHLSSVRAAVRPRLVSPEAGDWSRPVGGHVGDSLSHPETLEGKHGTRCCTTARPGRDQPKSFSATFTTAAHSKSFFRVQRFCFFYASASNILEPKANRRSKLRPDKRPDLVKSYRKPRLFRFSANSVPRTALKWL